MAKLQQNDFEVLLPLLTLKSPEESIRSTPANRWGSVIDSIYEQQQLNFISRLSTPVDAPKQALEKIQKIKLFTYPDPKKKTFAKEDGFFNPTAIYLSRKPLVFNRNFRRESMNEDTMISVSPDIVRKKKKNEAKVSYRRPLTHSQDYNPLQELRVKEKEEDELRALYKTTNTMREKEKMLEKIHETKVLRQEVLKKIDKQCKDMEKFKNVSPKVEQAKKIVKEYRKNIKWTSGVLENYQAQESEVLRHLFMLTDYARTEMNKDIAATAEQIKKGTMDPALKHRIRRKRSQYG